MDFNPINFVNDIFKHKFYSDDIIKAETARIEEQINNMDDKIDELLC